MINNEPGQLTLDQIVARHTNVGMEIEKMRVDAANRLSGRPFPAHLSAATRAFVTHEFFEAQLEFALPPDPDAQHNIAFGEQIIRQVAAKLQPGDRLWPYSCPPVLPRVLDERLISPLPTESYPYRKRLSRLYDMRRLMNTGVHINLSFSPEALTQLTGAGAFTTADELYLHLAQYFLMTRWLFTYLFGATPVARADYFAGDPPRLPVRSLRSSTYGFPSNLQGDYRSVPGYVARIEDAIARGELMQAGQFYTPVRLKSAAGKAPHLLLEHGVSHLELRVFDLDPHVPLGASTDQVRFVQSLAVFFAVQPQLDPDEFEIREAEARRLNERIALEDPRHVSICQEKGIALLSQLMTFARQARFPADYRRSIAHYMDAMIDHRKSLAYTVWRELNRSHNPLMGPGCATDAFPG